MMSLALQLLSHWRIVPIVSPAVEKFADQLSRRMPNPRRTGATPWRPINGTSGPITVAIEFDSGH